MLPLLLILAGGLAFAVWLIARDRSESARERADDGLSSAADDIIDAMVDP